MRGIYKRYHGRTGQVERVAEPGDRTPPPQETAAPPRTPPPRAGEEARTPPGPLSGLSGELGRLLNRLSPAGLETEDLLLIAVLYLLYRESGDREFLFAIGGLLLL